MTKIKKVFPHPQLAWAPLAQLGPLKHLFQKNNTNQQKPANSLPLSPAFERDILVYRSAVELAKNATECVGKWKVIAAEPTGGKHHPLSPAFSKQECRRLSL